MTPPAVPWHTAVALREPAGAGYAVTGQVTAGYMDVGIPQDDSSPRTVTARIVCGELDLRSR